MGCGGPWANGGIVPGPGCETWEECSHFEKAGAERPEEMAGAAWASGGEVCQASIRCEAGRDACGTGSRLHGTVGVRSSMEC